MQLRALIEFPVTSCCSPLFPIPSGTQRARAFVVPATWSFPVLLVVPLPGRARRVKGQRS